MKEMSVWRRLHLSPCLFIFPHMARFLCSFCVSFLCMLLLQSPVFALCSAKTTNSKQMGGLSDCVVCALPGSSSFESQKMDRPSISVTSPMSPSMLRDAPQYLSGQLSVSELNSTYGLHVKAGKRIGLLERI